jgi:hypothetical protein
MHSLMYVHVSRYSNATIPTYYVADQNVFVLLKLFTGNLQMCMSICSLSHNHVKRFVKKEINSGKAFKHFISQIIDLNETGHQFHLYCL